MIVLLSGKNSFARQEAYHALRSQYDPDDALAANTIVLDGARNSRGELEAAVLTMPFLAEFRMVRVDGLGARMSGGGRRRALGEWESLSDLLGGVPPTTVLVFFDDELTAGNPLRRAVDEAGGDVRGLQPAAGRASLSRGCATARARSACRSRRRLSGAWCSSSAATFGCWRASWEKLQLYAGEDVVDDTIVDSLVARSREGNIFQLVDAVAEGRPTRALHALEALRAGGETPASMIRMLARQYRMIAVAREVLDAGGGQREVQSALGAQSFVAERVVSQARRYDQAGADSAIARVLEAEVAIQNYWQGRDQGMNQDLALELLISELAQGIAV